MKEPSALSMFLAWVLSVIAGLLTLAGTHSRWFSLVVAYCVGVGVVWVTNRPRGSKAPSQEDLSRSRAGSEDCSK